MIFFIVSPSNLKMRDSFIHIYLIEGRTVSIHNAYYRRSMRNDDEFIHPCPLGCGRSYKLLSSLTRHLNLVKRHLFVVVVNIKKN
mgnify:FL=1